VHTRIDRCFMFFLVVPMVAVPVSVFAVSISVLAVVAVISVVSNNRSFFI
jgi:hypothetical protein